MGDGERTWINQVHESEEGKLCWPGRDGHFLRCTTSKRMLLVGEEHIKQEFEAFIGSKQQYLNAIIKDLDMRFTTLMEDLEDFQVLHSADQKGTGKRLRSLVERINKPGLSFEILMKQTNP